MFSSHIKKGLFLGSIGGVVTCAYTLGQIKRNEKTIPNNDYHEAGLFLENAALSVLAPASFIYGPILGATGGATLFLAKKGIKLLISAPRSVHLLVGATTATAAVSAIAFKAGNRE